MTAQHRRPAHTLRLALAGAVITALLGIAFLIPGTHAPSARGQTLPSTDSGSSGPETYYTYVTLVPGQDAILQANPMPGDPDTEVTVTIPADQVTTSGTALLSTGLNDDGSVSAVVTGGPLDAAVTACLGQGETNCAGITLDSSGAASFILTPQT